ncbi:sporulation protein [Peribacillus cavernae]|uniref:Sporulation protein n=1 Tax=Peribacillus cavernae TaxID=1674310 RepID=A0A433HW83_9BACI|nr:CAP domain-containing protein [Peribacillus cavernae]MDQ0217927.1 putative YkwD family protein [Peribacillus cavernae]RUQ32579.1 sporulation protein [Peribacillus cavernae]
MKKKMFFSAAAAAAVILSGAGVKQADASTIDYQVKPVIFQVSNQQEAEKLVNQYLSKYNVPKQQVQQPAEQPQKPAAQPQKQTEQSQKPVAQPQEQAEQPQQPAAQKPAAQQPAEQKPAADNTAAPTSSEVSQFEKQVVELTNAERAKQGLKALQIDNELSKVAGIKSQDMKDKNYFDHNSPTYGSPFDMMKKFGISYSHAGENIAMGQKSPQEVVQGWMNSQGHRENIMNANFTHIGVGHVASGDYWTQMFIGK